MGVYVVHWWMVAAGYIILQNEHEHAKAAAAARTSDKQVASVVCGAPCFVYARISIRLSLARRSLAGGEVKQMKFA